MNKEMINSAAKWGLIFGVSMSALHIAEIKMTLSGDLTLLLLLTLEKVFAAALFVYILFRANREQAKLVADDEVYGFSKVLNFSLWVTLFGTVIVAVASHTYVMTVVGGYAKFASDVLEISKNLIASVPDGEKMGSVGDSFVVAIEQATKQPSPSIWDSVFAMYANNVLGALLSTVIIFRFFRKKRV